MNVTPHFVPDAADAAAWYARAFGAREQSRVPLPGGKVVTVVLGIGESAVHIGREFPQGGILSPLSIGGTATMRQISTDDADVLCEQALAAGAVVRHELAYQFWGERHGELTDPSGHRWKIAQRGRDVPDDARSGGCRGTRAIMMAAELRIAITLDDYEQALKSDRRTSSHSALHRLGAR